MSGSTQPAESVKDQRDRFLAFAFSAADLFLEVSGEGRIAHAMGAARSVTGIDEKTLMGKRWLDLFSAYDQAMLIDMRDKARVGMRCPPALVTLSETQLNGRKAVLTGIKMPGSDRFYITLGVSNALMARIARRTGGESDNSVHGRDGFCWAAETLLDQMRGAAQDLQLILLDLGDVQAHERRLGESGWQKFLNQTGEILITLSVDGYCVGEIAEGRYAAVMDKKVDPALVQEKIAALARSGDPDGKGFDIGVSSIDADVKKMTSREISRSVAHAMEEFSVKGVNTGIAALSTAFSAFLSANAARSKELQAFIDRSGFTIQYQPVIEIAANKAAHFEMFCRFESGDTRDWFNFAQDTNQLPALDIAICERAINHVKFKAGTTRTKFCVNVSLQSAANADFAEKLTQKLDRTQNINEQLIFEIAPTGQKSDCDKAAWLVKNLQERGFKVVLDDGSGFFSSPEILPRVAPDFLKAGKTMVQNIATSQRDVAAMKKLLERCNALRIGLIAKFIEDERQLQTLKALGVPYGQGYFFGKPENKPEYLPGM